MATGRKRTRPRRVGHGPGSSSRDPQPARPDRTWLFWALAVGISAAGVYLNAFGHEFVLDDVRLVRDNLRIRSLAGIPHLFASSYWEVKGAQGLYRPLVLASYAVNYAIHGLSTSGYTAVNVGLHAAVSVLLFALVRAFGAPLLAGGIAGLAFAVHPVHTEAVTGIAGRAELLAACFFLLALHCHRLAPASARTSIGWRIAVLACFAGALLSKESAITLLLVVPVMDALVPAHDRAGRPWGPRERLVRDYLPLTIVAVAYLALRHTVLGGLGIDRSAIAPLDNPLVPLTTMPLGERLGATPAEAMMTAFAVVTEYARLLVWPARLSPDYSYDQIPLVASALDPRFLAGIGVVAACIAGIVFLWRRSPIAAFGLAWLALTYSVVSNVAISIGTICAERLIYLPSAGALVAAGIGFERVIRKAPAGRRLAYGIALAAVLLAGAARTWARNPDWTNDATLWSAAITAAPRSARVQAEYGRVLMTRADQDAAAGRRADAEKLYSAARGHFETALGIVPSYAPPMDGLATILSIHQQYDEALGLYERAVKVWPSGSFVSLTNWAGLLWDRSRRTAANASALRAEGRVAEADVLDRQADAGFRQAIDKVQQALSMNPSYAHAHLVRALLLDGYLRNSAAAIAEFEEVLRLMPDHPQRAVIETELARLKAHQASRTQDGQPPPGGRAPRVHA